MARHPDSQWVRSRLAFLVFILATVPLNTSARIDGLVSDPMFSELLETQPIVVIGQMFALVGKSSKFFEETSGEDGVPAYTELYEHYGFELVELLKGTLSSPFEIRIMAPGQSDVVLSFEVGVPVLLVLAPDFGVDPQQLPRETHLLVYESQFPVVDDTIQVPTPSGDQTWSIQDVRDTIAKIADERALRLARSPEPPEAAQFPVVSGEDDPVAPGEPPNESELPHGGLTDPELLQNVTPKDVIGVPEPSGLLMLGVGIAFLVSMQSRRGRS